ncbi:hypothetical protein PWT90_07490 [Aphanocladium album]|nr:hypothetical protein PWT90_07490 [Aphanocladium album]
MSPSLVTECPVRTETSLPPILASPAVSPTISPTLAASGVSESQEISELADADSKNDAKQEFPGAAVTLVEGGAKPSATSPPTQASSGQRNLVSSLVCLWMIAPWVYFMA